MINDFAGKTTTRAFSNSSGAPEINEDFEIVCYIINHSIKLQMNISRLKKFEKNALLIH